MTEHDLERRRFAVEETVARVNAERAAIGLPPGVKLGITNGIAHLALIGDDVAEPVRKRERVLLNAPEPPGKRARIRL